MQLRTDQLDGLRFLAFLMVFWFHLPGPKENVYVHSVEQRGWVGVEVFFALSAFLLFRLFQQEHEATGRISISQFFVRRLLRIYPLMMVFALVMLLVYGATNPAALGWLLSLATFVGNYVSWFPEKGQSIVGTGHFWSLSYEFQIYLALPFLFLASLASGKRAFVLALLATVPLCLAARAAFMLSGLSWQMIYMTPLVRPESTIVGILVALGMTQRMPIAWMYLALAASASGLLFLPDIYSKTGSVTIYVSAAVFSGSLLHVALYSSNFARILRLKPIAYLGRISFGLFVFHLSAGRFGVELLGYLDVPITASTHRLATFVICTLLASLSYFFFERPLLRLKPRYRTSADTRIFGGTASTDGRPLTTGVS